MHKLNKLFLSVIFLGFLFFISSKTASAATCQWTGNTNTAWATNGNWSSCSGTGTLGPPATTDSVVIVSAANSPVITTAITIVTLTMTSGTLTISAGTSPSLTITGTGTGTGVILNGGTFNSGGFAVNLTGAAPFWNFNGGTYTPSGSTVSFTNTAAGTKTVQGTAASGSFYNLTFSNGARAGSITSANMTSLTVTNNLTISNSTGTVTVAGTIATLNLNNLILSNTSTGGLSLGTALTTNITGTATLTQGTLTTAANSTINIGGNWTAGSSFVFTKGAGSTVNFNSTAADQTINGTLGTQTFLNLTVNKTGYSLLVGGSMTVMNISGTVTLTAGTFNVSGISNLAIHLTATTGTWANNGGTFTPGTSTVLFDTSTTAGTRNINGTAATQTFNNLTFNTSNTSGSRILLVGGSTTTLNVTGTLYIQLGLLNITNVTLNIGGNLTRDTGTGFTTAGSTVNFNSTAATQNINGTIATQTFNNLTISNTGNIVVVGGSATAITVTGTVTLASGEFQAGTAVNINLTGATSDWTNNGGTFTPGTGTVTFNNSSAGTKEINGTAATQTFNMLTINCSGRTVAVNGSTTTLTLNDTFTITAGTFQAGTLTTFNVGRDWVNNGTYSNGTIDTVVFNGSAAQAISGASTTSFHNLTIANASNTVSTSVSFNVNAGSNPTFTINSGAIFSPAAANLINSSAAGTITGSGTILISRIAATADYTHQYQFTTNTLTGLTLNYSGAGAQTVNTAPGILGGLTVSGSDTKTLDGTLSVGTVTLTAATFATGNNNITITGDWTNNGGTFTPGTGTVTFSNGSAQNLNGSAATQTFYAIDINKSGNGVTVGGSTTTLNIGGGITLNAGAFTAGTATDINVTVGDWNNNGGTFTPGSGTVTFSNASANQNITGISASQTFNSITVNKTGQILAGFGSTTTLNIGGTLTLTAGTFSAGTAVAINVGGDWTNNGGSFTNTGSTVTFNSTSATQNINGSAIAETFNNLVVSKSGQILQGAGSIVTLNINGNITISAGNLTAGTATTINCLGNWTNSVGTAGFTAGTGTVDFAPSGSSATVSGATIFNNFTSTAAGKTLRFIHAQTFRINGLLTLTGAPGNLLNINSDDNANQWLVNHQGTENVTYVNITYSGCDGSSTDITLDVTNNNGGHNGTCWVFPSPTPTPTPTPTSGPTPTPTPVPAANTFNFGSPGSDTFTMQGINLN